MEEIILMEEQTIIIGAGPCGLSCALELQKADINPLIIEKGNIVETIYRFPTHQTFFSTSFNLEIGDIPFVSEKSKPVRNEALAYYREVAKRNSLRIRPFEKAIDVKIVNNHLIELTTVKNNRECYYKAKNIVIATGYYDQPKFLQIRGENLPKVMHYFKEAHEYYDTDVVVIGGRNSAVDAALELQKVGARVTVLYRADSYSKSIKPWILPQFDSFVQKGDIQMEFHANVTEITEENVFYEVKGKQKKIKNDFVFAMTGYEPDIPFLKRIGLNIDSTTGKPIINEQTYETNIPNIYVAGVVVSGYNGNETFIENGRFHGKQIATSIINKGQENNLS
ncbi:YpdA family putative bacillithiol disulfide reductase [Pseudogracilibacillus auburnensis]|uniref:YpdA family putative bacillithiol disulfide reductase n=1 Tax=Pseudogracilibacillus auburnensis TaxID=1494959 RepID=UPI001A974503|nr:YpdA family putative bacillithiol disulfide reductase [Pseudogracilibacillus auburnensis]MBO1003069.1 YpdA family putative bacillithiol disulfide reductase [Pseudogracilibacillus auburnensis]